MMLAQGFHTIDAAAYHQDPCQTPSLSSSLAKVLLNSTPRHAWLKHPRMNPQYEPGDDSKFDIGSVAHEMILGVGGGFQVLDFADYRTKAAQAARDEAVVVGLTPILTEQHKRAEKMASAVVERVRQVPSLEQAFFPEIGMREKVLIWQEPGAMCRAMLDYWGPDETTVIDIKTTGVGLSNGSLSRQIVNLSYDLSAAFYMRGLRTLRPDLAGKLRWLWIFVESDAPHEVRVVQADATTLAIGERKACLAIELWRRCMASGEWPGYAPRIETVDYPAFAESQWTERELTDPAAMTANFPAAQIENRPRQLMGPI